MKIQCDVCEKEEATMFCSADEAALCNECDRRVHGANKLASQHTRYSLQHPTFKDSPLCDICQERRALLFCQEDRAILCRECDIPIHRANEHTQKHNRFLLTGVKISSSDDVHHQPSLPSEHPGGFVNPTFDVGQSTGRFPHEEENQMVACDDGSISASSISEYLMETLPGWRVDEFLDCQHHHNNNSNNNNNNNNYSAASHGYCKTSNHGLPMPDYDFGSQTSSSYSISRDLPISVPQFSTQLDPYHNFPPHNSIPQHPMSSFDGVRDQGRSKKSSRRRSNNWFYEAQFSQGINSFVL